MNQILIDGKYPFIGGPLDGKLRQLNSCKPFIYACDLAPIPKIALMSKHLPESRYDVCIYRREMFATGGGVDNYFIIYIAEDMTNRMAMMQLLKRYCEQK